MAMDDAADRRATAIFLLAISVYFAAQVGLRLALGGAYETDEAEMLVMTPGLRLGYGPQLPLYNWLQLGFFELFGRGLLALSLLKNLLLWLTAFLAFLGLRIWLPASGAALAALSLFLLPDYAWEAQRATTHSNMLLVTSAATLAAFLWAVKGGRLIAWALLGIAIGLGGLAKYNFYLVPLGLVLAGLTLAPLRAQILRRRALIAPAIAAAIVALPYRWMIANRDLAFSSVGKLQLEAEPVRQMLPAGLLRLPEGLLALLGLALIVAAGLWLFGRSRGKPVGPGPVAALLLRAAIVATLLTAVGVWLAQAGTLTARWLLPLAFLSVLGIFAALAPRLGRGGRVGLVGFLGLVALLVFTGLTYDRFKEGARRDVDFSLLPERLAAIEGSEGLPVIAEFYTAGNLAARQPLRPVAPYLPFAARRFEGETVLFLLRETVPPSFEVGLERAGWPAFARFDILSEGDFTLPYMHSDEDMPFRYVLARPVAQP
ncbi:hypothetical protein BV379_15755 [Rhodovulum sulfidophilum]|nr:hypothetical protein BV379_15755 [Rhodovulum sulfidophilum]